MLAEDRADANEASLGHRAVVKVSAGRVSGCLSVAITLPFNSIVVDDIADAFAAPGRKPGAFGNWCCRCEPQEDREDLEKCDIRDCLRLAGVAIES